MIILIILLIITTLVLFYRCSQTQGQIEQRARTIFESWRRQKEDEDTRQWKENELERLSDDKAKNKFEN
ncbi:Holliday junction resolvase-like protein [Methanomicrobium sp. W14]|uniref:Holliday junction resolvase-like protein n=1 Tax=Methanomicrobium sp. W14 TaxID=2817839 RepID=UPI001AEA6296